MPDEEPVNENIALLRQRAEEAARFEDENAKLKRQLALRDSGYKASDPLVAHLMANYTGEATPEAIEGFLGGLGVTRDGSTQAAQEEEQPQTFDQGVATGRRSLSSESQPPGASQRVRTDPYEAIMLNKQYGMQQGRDPDTLMEEGLAALLGAASMGDQRVIIPQTRTGYNDPRTAL